MHIPRICEEENSINDSSPELPNKRQSILGHKQAKRKGTLADFLANSPLRDSEIDTERLKDQPRKIDLFDDP
jgi:hypothetical protein